jgi:thioredoxin reductase (NADPH)
LEDPGRGLTAVPRAPPLLPAGCRSAGWTTIPAPPYHFRMNMIRTEMDPVDSRDGTEDALIAGAGPIGLACAVALRRVGLDPLVIDAGAVVNSIAHYPIGMGFFTTADRLEIGGHPLTCARAKPTREEALAYYRGVARAESLRVRTFTKLLDASRKDSGEIACAVSGPAGAGEIRCRRLVLATGYYDHPNMIGVPGEELPHVSHYFDEAHSGYARRVAVVGGGNSACDAALELYRAGARVTLIHRGGSLPSTVKYWIRPDIENRIREGSIQGRFGAEVVAIEERAVIVRPSGAAAARSEDRSAGAIHADRVYLLTGYHPDLDLFRRIGIELDPETCAAHLNPETLETNVPGVFMAGSITRGLKVSEIFIENGRDDGARIARAIGSGP